MNNKGDRKEEGKRIGNDRAVLKLKELKGLLTEEQLSERRLILKHYIVLDVFTHGSIQNFDLTGYTFELNIFGNAVTAYSSTGMAMTPTETWPNGRQTPPIANN